MKKIFVTGIAGSGKTAISHTLSKMGYEAYDIEDDEYGLFKMFRKDTGERYMDYDNTDIDKVNNARWLCDIPQLQNMLDKQKNDIAFYCGIGNNEEIMPLFDASVLLQASPEVLEKRLKTREGTDDFANTEAGRKRVLSWKDEFEVRMVSKGMVAVDADPPAEDVAKVIVNKFSI